VLNGIDPGVFQRDPSLQETVRQQFGVGPGDVVVCGVGRLEAQKRFDLLLHAFARASAGRTNWRLLIAGEGSCREELERLSNRLGLSERVRFLGQVRDVVTLHHAVDLFVQSSDYEGTSNAVLEAMALETPVVATDVGGTAELIEHGVHGTIVPPNDLAALANAITSAIGNPDTTVGMAAAARTRIVETLSFDRRAHRVDSIYEGLVEGPGARSSGRRKARRG
jgi:glycosyltransferase involved in cell wall biosynthesis